MHCSWVAAAQHHCCVVDRQCRARALTPQARNDDHVLPSAGVLVQSPVRTPFTRPAARVAIKAESVDPRH